MKKILIYLFSICFVHHLEAQISVRGVSPAPIANNYNFTWADPSGGDWGTPDLTIPGTFVQGQLMMVNDGSVGTNAQGNPISAEGCNTLLNNFGGIVGTLSVIEAGSGYSSASNVSTSQGNGNGLMLNLNVSQSVVSLNNTSLNPGSGYSNGSNVGTSTNGSGNGLTVDITAETIGKVLSINSQDVSLSGGYSNSNGVVTSTNGAGSGLTFDILASPIIDSVLSLNNASLAPGFGYVTASNVATSSNSLNGNGLTVNVTAEEIGKALGFSLFSSGSNYVDSVNVSTAAVTGQGTGLTVGYITSSGNIDSVYIVNPGSGYVLNDTVKILAGDNTAALIIDSVSLGLLQSVVINNPGSGYIVGDTVFISGGQNGSVTIASVGYSGGNISSVTINQPGQGYEIGDTIIIQGGSAYVEVDSVSLGQILSVTINNAGSGYSPNDSIFINNGSNGSILVQSVIDSISSVTVQNGGTGYEVGDTILVSTGNGNALVQVESLKGIIAVIYRNNCEFGKKALNAQNAGAIAAIIINRDPEVFEMGGGADGGNVNIPVVMLSSIDGAVLVNEMANGPVEVFIGNKQNLFANDGGASKEQALISRYGSVPLAMANNAYTFGIGLQMYNFGSANNTFTVTAEVKDPSGNSVYNEEVLSAPIASGDTLPMFAGNTYSFPDFTMTNAVVGQYTLTYTIAVDGVTDESDYDNVITSAFNVTNDVLSLARQNSETGKVLVNSFPSNATTQYQACMRLQDVYPNVTTGVEGLYFAVNATNDTIENESVTAEIYEWNDGWTDASGGWATVTFDDLNPVGVIDYVCASNDDNEKVVYAPFASPVLLNDDQRYLVCLTTYNPEVGFGYDNGISYDGNYGIYAQPIAPVKIDSDPWYSGWNGASAFSVGMKIVGNVGIEALNSVDGIAYPNPANDMITVSIESSGKAQLTVSDISGKIAYTGSLNLINGKADLNISTLDAGIYVFNVALENGKTSQFNVVKK